MATLVVGATGAGKSLLINRIYNELCVTHYRKKIYYQTDKKKFEEKIKKMRNPAEVSNVEVIDPQFIDITKFVQKHTYGHVFICDQPGLGGKHTRCLERYFNAILKNR